MKMDTQIFTHEIFGEIETVEYNGDIVFYANDIAVSLGYSDVRRARDHCKSLITLNMAECAMLGLRGSNHGNYLIKESDLYRMVMKSKLQQAELFQDWVCEVVLPSIRSNGAYIDNQENKSPEEIVAHALIAAQSIIEEKTKLLKVNEDIIQDKNFPISLTKMFSGNNKVVQAANLWLEGEGYITKVFKKGKKIGWELTEHGEELKFGSQVGDGSVFWTPSILKFLPSTNALLKVANELNLTNHKA